ncbi:MAG: hypothetical protein HYY02_09510 [Chloroflexi bacterium]|nr:hypothetical protein [Chloroflexota bacterium]
MGYYYSDQPPRKPRWWDRFVKEWMRRFWADTEEVLVVTRVAFSIILPVVGVLFGFVLLCFLGLFLLSLCSPTR